VADFQRQQRARDPGSEAEYLRRHPVDIQVGGQRRRDGPGAFYKGQGCSQLAVDSLILGGGF
jgi:hypothetical protein